MERCWISVIGNESVSRYAVPVSYPKWGIEPTPKTSSGIPQAMNKIRHGILFLFLGCRGWSFGFREYAAWDIEGFLKFRQAF